MKRKLGGLLLLVGAALGLMAFRGQVKPPDLSSPRATVRSFIEALKSGDAAAIQQCVYKGNANQDVIKQVFGNRFALSILSVNTLVTEIDNDTAHVAAEITMRVPASSQPGSRLVPVNLVDMFTLVKQGETWQLTPDPTFARSSINLDPDSTTKYLENRPISFAVVIAGSPQVENILKEVSRKGAGTLLSLQCETDRTRDPYVHAGLRRKDPA